MVVQVVIVVMTTAMTTMTRSHTCLLPPAGTIYSPTTPGKGCIHMGVSDPYTVSRISAVYLHDICRYPATCISVHMNNVSITQYHQLLHRYLHHRHHYRIIPPTLLCCHDGASTIVAIACHNASDTIAIHTVRRTATTTTMHAPHIRCMLHASPYVVNSRKP